MSKQRFIVVFLSLLATQAQGSFFLGLVGLLRSSQPVQPVSESLTGANAAELLAAANAVGCHGLHVSLCRDVDGNPWIWASAGSDGTSKGQELGLGDNIVFGRRIQVYYAQDPRGSGFQQICLGTGVEHPVQYLGKILPGESIKFFPDKPLTRLADRRMPLDSLQKHREEHLETYASGQFRPSAEAERN
jgi:hypothetical protein